MAKLESNIRNMVLSLTIIAVAAAAILALVSSVTAEPIALAKKAKQEAAIRMVLPPFEQLQNDTATFNGIQYPYFKAFNESNEMVGMAVQSGSENGFGGYIGIMIGFDNKGAISGYQILETSETPGLGSKADVWFQKGGKGCVYGNDCKQDLVVSKDGGQIDAISGATITSRAILQAINDAHSVFTQKQSQQ